MSDEEKNYEGIHYLFFRVSLLRSVCSPQHVIVVHLKLCSSFGVRDQVSHSYEATGRLQFLHITLIFPILGRRREATVF
jgi:hypothetical protein